MQIYAHLVVDDIPEAITREDEELIITCDVLRPHIWVSPHIFLEWSVTKGARDCQDAANPPCASPDNHSPQVLDSLFLSDFIWFMIHGQLYCYMDSDILQLGNQHRNRQHAILAFQGTSLGCYTQQLVQQKLLDMQR